MTAQDPAKADISRDRLASAQAAKLSPDSLVGSFFHGSDDNPVQGCVVAEPVPGVYLAEYFEWIAGSSSNQGLVRIEDMTGWRFYDSSSWMNENYKNNLSRRWKQLAEHRAEGQEKD